MLPEPLPNCSKAAAIATTASRMVTISATSASRITRIGCLYAAAGARRCRQPCSSQTIAPINSPGM